jgi:hypothetical protein
LLEDTLVISPAALNRSRRLGVALLLLAVPACGLSDYEALMRETQEREEQFRLEQKYLGPPVKIPEIEKDDKKVQAAKVFFRPPKGIDTKAQSSGMMWRYSAKKGASDFIAVDMAFAEDNKDFAQSVRSNYQGGDSATGTVRQITPPGQKTPMAFDVWQFNSGETAYSVNVLKVNSKPVAIVYLYNKAKAGSVSKVIELSLQSLGVEQSAGRARERFNQQSPWKLQAEPSS